ncbi:MAG: metal-sulfur cluster assembly factor [Gemmatimonadales bacterium]
MAGVEAVWEALGKVTDPEYPLSIVDMGMVYEARVEGDRAHVDITFTSIGCPAIDMICSDVREAVLAVSGISNVELEIVWSPPWSKDRISDRGRRVLRMYGVVN